MVGSGFLDSISNSANRPRQRNDSIFTKRRKKFLLVSAIFLAALEMARKSTSVIGHDDSTTWIDSSVPHYSNQDTKGIFGSMLRNDYGITVKDAYDSGTSSHPLSYSMKRDSSYNMTFSQATPCTLGVTTNKWGRHPQWREPLLEGLQPLLNFTTTIRTHLNLLVMGDSVGIQFGQLLEEALGAKESSRTLIHEAWVGHDGVTISSTAGGGALANYRITGMFLAEGEGKPLPNAYGGGWNRSHVDQLLRHPHLNRQSYRSSHTLSSGASSFDVMIFRIPHGWLTFADITENTLHETMQMAYDIFGIRKVILIDIPHTNNVMTIQDLEDRLRTNLLLQEIAATYPRHRNHPTNGGEGVEEVVVLKFARWTDHLMEYNARVIGLIPSDQVVANKSYTLDRLGCRRKFPLSIAQGCAEFAKAGDCKCRRNRIAEDGIHWCLESIGGRLVAGIACLLSCFQFSSTIPISRRSDGAKKNLRDCEEECNHRFMSLGPLNFQDGAVFG